jgi:hypothetical protein
MWDVLLRRRDFAGDPLGRSAPLSFGFGSGISFQLDPVRVEADGRCIHRMPTNGASAGAFAGPALLERCAAWGTHRTRTEILTAGKPAQRRALRAIVLATRIGMLAKWDGWCENEMNHLAADR